MGGVPLLVARWVTGPESAIWLLLGATAIWTIAHRHRSPGSGTVDVVAVSGLLLVYRWPIGLWWVAIFLEAGHDAIVRAVELLNEWWDRRHRPFHPGDAYHVTIIPPDELPPVRGIFGTDTTGRKRLYVPGLDPGESARVRVATTIGFFGFGFPVDGPGSGDTQQVR